MNGVFIWLLLLGTLPTIGLSYIVLKDLKLNTLSSTPEIIEKVSKAELMLFFTLMIPVIFYMLILSFEQGGLELIAYPFFLIFCIIVSCFVVTIITVGKTLIYRNKITKKN